MSGKVPQISKRQPRVTGPERSGDPLGQQGAATYLKTLCGKVGLAVRVPKSTRSCHDDKWDTIRYALDSNARTIRLCLIWIVVIGMSTLAATAAGLLPYLLSRP